MDLAFTLKMTIETSRYNLETLIAFLVIEHIIRHNYFNTNILKVVILVRKKLDVLRCLLVFARCQDRNKA